VTPILLSDAMKLFGLQYHELVQFPRVRVHGDKRAYVRKEDIQLHLGRHGKFLSEGEAEIIQLLRVKPPGLSAPPTHKEVAAFLKRPIGTISGRITRLRALGYMAPGAYRHRGLALAIK